MKEKTNVMRVCDRAKIQYSVHSYADTDAVSGTDVARVLNQDPNQVFKTLVTIGKSKHYYVFMIPVGAELDLKKAAAAAEEKSIQMIPSKDLFSLTGYIHGGCSPIGMKKVFKTTIDGTAGSQETIIFSAGKIGYQVEMSIHELSKLISLTIADIITEAVER